MEEKFYVTEEGLNDLKKELETLIHVTREEVIEELKAARAQGDLSENADYDAARDHQAKVESRIKELEHQIKNAEIITESKKTNFVRNLIPRTRSLTRSSVQLKLIRSTVCFQTSRLWLKRSSTTESMMSLLSKSMHHTMSKF